jgi:CBS domain-containing protein
MVNGGVERHTGFEWRGAMSSMSYLEIRKYREQKIVEAARDHFTLNQLHDEIMKRVINQAIEIISDKFGSLPCPFSFFVTGSSGRYEQSVWSDQDHGMIYYEQSDEVKNYFWQLGKEISKGLNEVGYQYCDGGVMASNLLWCKSLSEWQVQLSKWIEDSSWESIRYLIIFMDARAIFGENGYVEMLKKQIYQTENKAALMTKVLNNSMYLKKGINLLGQLLTETHGPYTGSLNLKEIGIFPYVSAARLLAVKENRLETSTLARLAGISETLMSAKDKELYKTQFLQLLHYRLLYCRHTDYYSGHYLPVSNLTKEEIKKVKDIVKNGTALFHSVRKLLENSPTGKPDRAKPEA